MAQSLSDIRRDRRQAGEPTLAPVDAPFGDAKRRLDFATGLGLIGGFAMVAIAVALGGSFRAFVDVPSLFIVLGGTLAATTVCFSLPEVIGTHRAVLNALVHRSVEPDAAALQLLALAEAARRNGVLTLEHELPRFRGQPFLKKALMLAIDGVQAEDAERTLQRELYAIQARHARSAGVLRKAAEIAPAMGLIGTLVGLVQMLAHLDDPASVGPGMAVALITTFYGALLATLLFSPLAAKLERNSADEALLNQLYLLGCQSICRQENPRRLETQLNTLLPPGQRVTYFT